MTRADPRLLFLLSADYGELSNALYFLRGYEFDAHLLMPERLLSANRDELPVPASAYRTLADILGQIEDQRPDVVFLFSGYLYALNQLLSLADIEALVRALSSRGIRAVVGDPFLGLLQQSGPSPFSDRHPGKAMLTEHFGALARVFAQLPHLYLARPARASATPQVVFFNPRLLIGAAQRASLPGRLAQIGADPARAHWLFVLAAEDYGAQASRLGVQRFEALLGERLGDAPRCDRQAVLIAPHACAERIAAKAIPGVHVLSFCSHARFNALLLTAEHAFYWNLFSNSATARLANRLPVLHFDAGHMAHAIPPLLELGLQSYFPGAQLELLDLARPLELAALDALASAQERSLTQAHARLREAPAPDQVVASLLDAGPG
jgi:hypothetical protein